MALYWMTFRLRDDAGYDDRYAAFLAAVDQASTGWWNQTTSFYLLESELALADIAARITNPLNARTDILVIRTLDNQSARYFGPIEHESTLRAFMPYAKKLG